MTNIPVTFDREGILDAYKDVRSDKSQTIWAVFNYNEDNKMVHLASGDDYSEFLKQFEDDNRIFAFARLITGDELSRRAKFVLYSWSGKSVGAMKRAQMGASDKSNMKKLLQSFSMEVHTDDHEELQYDHVLAELRKTGGANYGTGV